MKKSGFSVRIGEEKKIYTKLIPSQEEKIRYWAKRLSTAKDQATREKCESELKKLLVTSKLKDLYTKDLQRQIGLKVEDQPE